MIWGLSDLKFSEGREDPELDLLELEEWVAQCLCGCQSLLGVSHQQLTDL